MGDFSALAQRIKSLRISLKLTQREFAKKAGCTAATLSAYENGSKSPSLEIVKGIAEAFHVSIDWLCGLSEKRNYNDTIETYGDAIRLLLKLDEKLDIAVSTGFTDIPSFDCVPYAELNFGNLKMQEFLKEWEKMKELHDHCTIDDEVYSLWTEKTLKKYDAFPAIGEGRTNISNDSDF